LYARPNLYFSAVLYQPLYYYLVAPVVHFTGASFLAGRIVTILATVLTAIIIGAAVARLTARSAFAVVLGLGLFFSTYALTDYVQTVVRIDSLYVLFIICAVLAVSYRTYVTSALTAILLACAYFT